MLGKVGTPNKRVTNVLAHHPTTSIVAVFGIVRELRKLDKHLSVLEIMQST